MTGADALRWFAPGAVLLLAGALVAVVPGAGGGIAAFFQAYPYLVPAGGILIAIAFRRGRGALALLVLALADVTLRRSGAAIDDGAGVGTFIWNSVTLLLPVNLAVVALVRERSLLTPAGVVGTLAVAVQPFAAALVWLAYLPWLIAAIGRSFIASSWLPATALSQPALLAFGLAAVAVVVRVVRTPGPFEAGMVWTVIGSFFALVEGRLEPRTTLLLAAATLTVVVGITEASAATAYRDGLTGLPARRALDEALEALRGRYTIAMVDVDHFKQFNDTHGHDVGDQVLRMVAAKLRGVGGGGRAYRFGGEEFAVLFTGRGVNWARPHLERLRQGIAGTDFTLRGTDRPKKRPKRAQPRRADTKRLSLTVSIGLAESTTSTDKPEQVLRAADTALYRAKEAGRNRVSP